MASRHPLSEVRPDEFVQARNALVQELRRRGESEEAKRVAALRRPSAPLWIVNQLARRASGRVEELIESTQRTRRAQVHARGGDELREAMQDQREALHALLQEAEKAAAAIGASLTPEVRRRVQDTLQTAAATGPDALREGALEQELSAAGFGTLLGGASAVAAKAASQKSAFRAHAAEQKEKLEKRREEILRRREIQHAQQTARNLHNHARQLEQMAARAREAAVKAEARAREAQSAADAAAARLLELQR